MHGLDPHDEIDYWRERFTAAEKERDEARGFAQIRGDEVARLTERQQELLATIVKLAALLAKYEAVVTAARQWRSTIADDDCGVPVVHGDDADGRLVAAIDALDAGKVGQ